LDPFTYLFSLEQFGIKFGLENISAIVARLGHPERAFESVHVAGTNGKGSVTAMVDAALRAAGHRSARYTSPHLVDLGERFVVDGRAIDRPSLAAAIETVRAAIEELTRDRVLAVQPTFFEVATAVAFELFRRADVDVAVLEVGMGGRLDATNVVVPEVAAITSIAFDHQRYLGSTLREIAIEKAGIIKPGVPVVVGPLPAEALDAIEAVAAERGAELIRTSPESLGDAPVGLAGVHQRANAAVALAILQVLNGRGIKIPDAAIADGLACPQWPGRLDLRRLADGRDALLDAAHNPAGAAALSSYLTTAATDGERRFVRPPLVFAAMRDKDIEGMFRALLPAVGPVVLTRASNPRSAAPDELAAIARAIDPARDIVVESSPAAALDAAWHLAPRIVVAGSIFLLGDVLELIGPA
jgi:dihydrofolate synthase / folylpolyglutamate synthase